MELAPEDLEKSLEELGIEWRKILMNKKWISRQGKRGKLGRLGKSLLRRTIQSRRDRS
jgi:hypothetical protein